jgi:hypothetical protein
LGDLGLKDAVEEGGFDGLEPDEGPFVVGEFLEEPDLDGGCGGKVVEVLAVELPEGLGVIDGQEGRVVEDVAAAGGVVWAGCATLGGLGIELGCSAHRYSPTTQFRRRRGGFPLGMTVSD